MMNNNNDAVNHSSSNSNKDVQAARRGLLKAIFANRFSSIPIDLQTNHAPNFSASDGAFSSKPIEMDGYFSSINYSDTNTCTKTKATTSDNNNTTRLFQESASYLTSSEQNYLHGLLRSNDLDSIRRASVRLSNTEIFPTTTDSDDEEKGQLNNNNEASGTKTQTQLQQQQTQQNQQKRRDSLVQEHLLEWHEKATIMPSAVLKRMSSNPSARNTPPLPVSRHPNIIPLNNSLTQDENNTTYEACSIAPTATCDTMASEEVKEEYQKNNDKDRCVQQKDEFTQQQPSQNDKSNGNFDLLDINNWWIDKTEGVEVDEEGHPTTQMNSTSTPFKILGTSADDVSCQPMVLSPPLMEGLLLFMPESLHEYHYWLKYSMVRDGPGLMKMLRQCRGSQHTILAIESKSGHVFGSFTSQPWRSTTSGGGSGGDSDGDAKIDNHRYYYGSKESFVWRMRQSRFESCKSVVEQILMESKMDIFPFTSQNDKVQSCTTCGIALGFGEVQEEQTTTKKQLKHHNDDNDNNNHVAGTMKSSKHNNSKKNNISNKHYGHAIQLDKSMTCGSTSSSETFGSPCLIERESRGKIFEIANVELWALTPHEKIKEANHAEMELLFLEENRQNDNLNLIEILVA